MPSVNRAVVAARPVPGAASDRWPSPLRSPPPVGFARCPLPDAALDSLNHRNPTPRYFILSAPIDRLNLECLRNTNAETSSSVPKRRRSRRGSRVHLFGVVGELPAPAGRFRAEQPGTNRSTPTAAYLEITDFSQRRARETVRCAPQICPLFRRAQNRLRSAHRWK